MYWCAVCACVRLCIRVICAHLMRASQECQRIFSSSRTFASAHTHTHIHRRTHALLTHANVECKTVRIARFTRIRSNENGPLGTVAILMKSAHTHTHTYECDQFMLRRCIGSPVFNMDEHDICDLFLTNKR